MAELDRFVCDTHSLVWFLTRDRKLSLKAREALLLAQDGAVTAYIPTVVLSEFLHMASRGKVPWDRLFSLLAFIGPPSGFRIVPLDADTFSRMMYLLVSPQPLPRLELHDLAIFATASLLDRS